MKIKTKYLINEALDWAVTVAQGRNEQDYVYIDNLYGPKWDGDRHDEDWAYGGPIIAQEKINLEHDGFQWWAHIKADEEYPGSTPLIAAMRCFVASRLGEEVDVHDALCGDPDKSYAALMVLLHDPVILKHLETNDPMALRQAREAIKPVAPAVQGQSTKGE